MGKERTNKSPLFLKIFAHRHPAQVAGSTVMKSILNSTPLSVFTFMDHAISPQDNKGDCAKMTREIVPLLTTNPTTSHKVAKICRNKGDIAIFINQKITKLEN